MREESFKAAELRSADSRRRLSPQRQALATQNYFFLGRHRNQF